jgi:hypothetical protein
VSIGNKHSRHKCLKNGGFIMALLLLMSIKDRCAY